MINPISIFHLFVSFTLFTFNIYNPYFGLFLGLISPLFLIFYFDISKSNFKIELIVALLIYGYLFKIIALYYILFVLLPVIFIVKGKEKAEFTAGLPSLIVTIIIILFLPNIRDMFISTMISNINSYLEILKSSAPVEKLFYIEKISKNVNQIAKIFVYLMPSLSYGYIVFITYINKRFYLRLKKQTVKPFTVPFKFIPILVIGGFLILSKSFYTKMISYNTLIIFFVLFFLQGIEVLEYWLKKMKIPLILKYLVYFFVILEPPLTVIVSIFGLFDVWIDFRKLNKVGGENG
ncbi:hypothetical protein DEFDS_1990 [Deferribacter desulfuricans SSM1]|uniref:DUF2232 domain-containing protein n=1 Tax=Deferribacter desulfuricans (strain DSM 14783 / JCM 11476 / NBRC 101012 / SSM1) TaxID=639282 RepID=D3P9Q1_DEFDS|nr:DUF2232 domain-containing protein [Deferribacter desulfuricans]BAI81441.1 hypothetical protein DEFDS_1990 [Deferribacter desulfuricans SSM1]